LNQANSTSKLLKKESSTHSDIEHVMETGQEGSRMRAILKKMAQDEVKVSSLQPSGRGKYRPNM